MVFIKKNGIAAKLRIRSCLIDWLIAAVFFAEKIILIVFENRVF